MITFERYAEFLAGAARRVEPAIQIGLARVGDHALALAKEYVGHDNLWRPLTPDYVSDKHAAGKTGRVSATDTWLLSGDTLKSLAAEVDGHKATLGATTPQALWNEVGTAKMQPRPLLAMAMHNAMDFAGDTFGDAAVALLTPPEALRR